MAKRRFALFTLIFSFATALAAPRLAVPPEGVAFGEIAAGEEAAKSIEIRNVSSSPVAVSLVKGCCGADAAAPGAPLREMIAQVCVAALLCAGAFLLLAKGRRSLSLGFVLEVAARVVVGGVFVYAGAMKLCDVDAFRELLSRYGMVPDFALGFVAVTLPAFECVVGTLLVFSRWVRISAAAISAMLVVFVVALAQAGVRGLDVSCGCFGGSSFASGGVWEAVVRDIVLLVPSMCLVVRGRSRCSDA